MVSYAEQLSGNIDGLCRICSSPGSHSILDKIPPYLHGDPCEYPRWTAAIRKLITDVTGLEISKDDGLPQKICVLCISYLKHAHNFRRQAINNVAALLAAKEIEGKVGDSANIRIPVDVEYRGTNVVTVRSESSYKNSNKTPLQQVMNGVARHTVKQNNAVEEKRILTEATINRLPNVSPSKLPVPNAGIFSYTEKPFEEDDMYLDILKHNVLINIPKDIKEKKCPSCGRRFMFEASINEHLKECLQFKLVKFIKQTFHLLFLKENRSISSFEFIRRTIFSVRNCFELITNYDGLETEMAEDEVDGIISTQEIPDPTSTKQTLLTNLAKLRINYTQEGTKIRSPLMSDIVDDGESSITTRSTSISPAVSIARCEKCQVEFETRTDLEAHNFDYHRELHSAVVALNNLSSPFAQSYLKSSSREVEIVKNQLLSKTSNWDGTDYDHLTTPKVRCRNCRKRFSTTILLDDHVIQCRGKSPRQRSQPNSRGSPLSNSRGSPQQNLRGSPQVDRCNRNLNTAYFYAMERIKDLK